MTDEENVSAFMKTKRVSLLDRAKADLLTATPPVIE